ncbi:hypothetical protein FHX14_002908 [Rhizobium sp. BK619]|nr:hypothetical protein [Rhizobium sp. BK619]
MAREAERLMSGIGWLPEPLRLVTDSASFKQATVETGEIADGGTVEAPAPDLPAFLTDDADDASAQTDQIDEHQRLDAAE